MLGLGLGLEFPVYGGIGTAPELMVWGTASLNNWGTLTMESWG